MSLYSPCKQPSSSARQPGCGRKGSGNLLVLRFSDRLLCRVRKHAESFERWWMVLSGRFQCMGGGVQGSSFSLNSHSPALSEKRKKKKRQAKWSWLWTGTGWWVTCWILLTRVTNWQAAGNVNGLANGFSLCLCGQLVENVGLGLLICNLLQIFFWNIWSCKSQDYHHSVKCLCLSRWSFVRASEIRRYIQSWKPASRYCWKCWLRGSPEVMLAMMIFFFFFCCCSQTYVKVNLILWPVSSCNK